MPWIRSPHSSGKRATETKELMRRGESDRSRWAMPDSLASAWRTRAARAAALIPPGSRVLDLGAGRMELRQFLPAGCTYIPADIVPREEGCLVADLNKGEFPDVSVDCVSLLGVLEYVHAPDRLLARCAQSADRLVLSYCVYQHGSTDRRRGLGWVNDMRLGELERVLTEAGWRVEKTQRLKLRWTNSEYLLLCTKTQ
jgi:hypothetical protein